MYHIPEQSEATAETKEAGILVKKNPVAVSNGVVVSFASHMNATVQVRNRRDWVEECVPPLPGEGTAAGFSELLSEFRVRWCSRRLWGANGWD